MEAQEQATSEGACITPLLGERGRERGKRGRGNWSEGKGRQWGKERK